MVSTKILLWNLVNPPSSVEGRPQIEQCQVVVFIVDDLGL